MTAMEIACRVCASQPGEQCRVMGVGGWTLLPLVHAERTEDAAGIGEARGVEPTAEAFDRAVEASGLI